MASPPLVMNSFVTSVSTVLITALVSLNWNVAIVASMFTVTSLLSITAVSPLSVISILPAALDTATRGLVGSSFPSNNEPLDSEP